GLGGDEKASQRLTVLRAIDKLDRLGVEGVRLLLGAGRKDESGDFTKGAGLEKSAIEKIIVFAVSRKVTFLGDVTSLSPTERTAKGKVSKFESADGGTDYFVENNAATI